MPNINGGVLDGVRRIGAKVRELVIDGGLPGAPLGYRLRGATPAGPPTAGTWKTGDVVPDRNGILWTCTGGGTGLAASWTSGLLGVFYLDQYAGTDDQKMTAALAAWSAAGRGKIILSPRAHTFANQWSTSYTALTAQGLIIEGAGVAYNGLWGTPSAATVCTFTYSGAGAACMDFQHIGSIEIRGSQFKSANLGVPLFQTTNATPNLHDNIWSGGGSGVTCTTDAIVLGGTGSSAGSGDTAIYQGYQGQIYRNFFDGIRRTVLFQSAANSSQVHDNTISATCGSNLYLGAPFEMTGTSSLYCTGNAIYGNCIEGTHYPVAGVKCTSYSLENTLGPNGIFDTSSSNYCCYWFDDAGTSRANEVIDGYHSGSTPFAYDPANMNTFRSQIAPGSYFPGQVTFRGQVFFAGQGGAGPVAVDSSGNQSYFQVGSGVSQAYPAVTVEVKPGTQVTDGSTISGSNVLTSLTAAWSATDAGEAVSATGITSNTFIAWTYTHTTALPWQASCAYLAGQVARPTTGNSHLYQCTTAGTTGATQPTWPTAGGTVTDGTAVWTDLGTSATAAILTKAATATGTGLTVGFGRSGSLVQMTSFSSHHIIPSGSVPAAAVTGGAGTGATVAVSGTDVAHQVTLTTGTGPAAGEQFVLTFALPFAARPLGISITAFSAAAAAFLQGGYYLAGNASNYSFWSVAAPPASTALIFLVTVI